MEGRGLSPPVPRRRTTDVVTGKSVRQSAQVQLPPLREGTSPSPTIDSDLVRCGCTYESRERTMEELTTSRATDTDARIEALRETYAAINRNDIPAALAFLDPQIEW